jgi:hypothetical protein
MNVNIKKGFIALKKTVVNKKVIMIDNQNNRLSTRICNHSRYNYDNQIGYEFTDDPNEVMLEIFKKPNDNFHYIALIEPMGIVQKNKNKNKFFVRSIKIISAVTYANIFDTYKDGFHKTAFRNEFRILNKHLHSSDISEPSVIIKNKNPTDYIKMWHKNGKLHQDNGYPAFIMRYRSPLKKNENGDIMAQYQITWYDDEMIARYDTKPNTKIYYKIMWHNSSQLNIDESIDAYLIIWYKNDKMYCSKQLIEINN